MNNDLSFLIQLQTFDNALLELNEQASALAPSINKKNSEIETAKAGMKSLKDKQTSYQMKKKELEIEADTQEKNVKKHQAELNSLKSNDAYKAMLSEIDNAKKAQTKIEDQILVIMESIEQTDRELKAKDASSKADEARIKGEIQALETKKAEILTQVQAKEAERNQFFETIPAALRSQYEAIRHKKSGVAIVPITKNACSGCQMTVTANKMIEIKKAKTMVLCDSCMRILYLPPQETPTEINPSQAQPATTSST